MLSSKLHSSIGNTDKLYVDDVFSAYTYTGNGSTQAINNGIDLAGKGGLVWLKSRSAVENNFLLDTVLGNKFLISNSSDAANASSVLGFSSKTNGFSLNNNTSSNRPATSYASWTFRKAPKFFDVVTFTGNGGSNLVNHSLGQMPGMIILKGTSGMSNWGVWHRGDGTTAKMGLSLNSTNASLYDSGSGVTSTTFNPSLLRDHLNNTFSTFEETYVAYLFAHDPSADGIIQCGSFTTDGSGNATVNLGWEPQYVLAKMVSGTSDWIVLDAMRGLTMGNGGVLTPNTASAEDAGALMEPSATGFKFKIWASSTVVYLAIRRPNKPPTLGTQVYNAIARTGTGAAATVTGVGFAPDMSITKKRASGAGWGSVIYDKLRGVTATGNNFLNMVNSSAEETRWPGDQLRSLDIDGFTVGPDSQTGDAINGSGDTYINHFFKRAVGVHDQVCYTGTGVAKTEAHGLGVVPELMIIKCRTLASNWIVYAAPLGKAYVLLLESTDGKYLYNGYWNNTSPTASEFTVNVVDVNNANQSHVAYLFATKAGISKVGAYTGNGSSQTIDCGFTTGVRFVLIKRTDAEGDWYVWDTVRGLITGNDPHLSLNSTAAEITTDDSLDPASVGFIVNQLAATNINVTSATYIYLAFA